MFLTLLKGREVQRNFFIKLKKHYPKQWEHAGKPTIRNNGDIYEDWPTTKYLFKKLYTDSGSNAGIEYCDSSRLPMIYTYFLKVSAAPVFIGSLYIFGW